MSNEVSNFKFNISLSVLEHLGRNLYRSFITVIGEAISNSWDADAKNVWIDIDKKNLRMTIIDDGIGMNEEDFQSKFLKIGYSKRKKASFISPGGRHYIGRKGIGKLALLSCAKQIEIASRIENGVVVGGLIDNKELDEAISDDINSENYSLRKYSEKTSKLLISRVKHGTIINFEGFSDGIKNTITYLRQAIAMYFRFSLVDKGFNIFLNNHEISVDDLSSLSDNTQFVWQINDIDDPYLSKLSIENNNNVKAYKRITSTKQISGFIGTMRKPSNLKIRETDETVSLDLFVNGRLREKNILNNIHTARIAQSYLYGQIHYNDLDNEKDIFTTSREGVISSEPIYKDFLKEIKRILSIILKEWDLLREKEGEDGDPENERITSVERKAGELFDRTVKNVIDDPKLSSNEEIKSWVSKLRVESGFNISSYSECYLVENLLRNYVRRCKLVLSQSSKDTANRFIKKENEEKRENDVTYNIRQTTEDLQYLGIRELINTANESRKKRVEKIKVGDHKVGKYILLRNAVCHTSLITINAQNDLKDVTGKIKSDLNDYLRDEFIKNT